MLEYLVVLLIVIVLFGAAKLPALGAGLGKAVRNFKQAAGSGEPPRGDVHGRGGPPAGRDT